MRPGGSLGVTATDRLQTKSPELGRDLSRPLHVPRRDEQEEVGKFRAQLEENASENLLFARMRAPAEQDRARGIDAEVFQHRAWPQRAGRKIRRIG